MKEEMEIPAAKEVYRTAALAVLLPWLALWAFAPSAAQAQREGPTNLQLTPGAGTIAASWGVSSASGLTGFRIRWKKVGGGENGRVELPRNARSYTLTHLRHIKYEVIVRALYKEKGGAAVTGEATPQPSLEEPPEEESPVEEPPEEEEAEAPEEEAPEEEAPHETPGKVVVSATPTGPPTPSSGWSVVYADGFGAPIGNGPGQDNTWYPNNCPLTTNCKGFNSDELEVFSPSAVSITPEGLRLTCTYTAAAQTPGEKHYVCGTVRGQGESKPAGYSYLTWSPGKGQTLVFQAVAKFPPNTGDADPGWWASGPPWNDTEIDFFEGGGASRGHTTGWRTDPMYTAWFAAPHPTANKPGFTTDPSLAFHTYTFELKPDNTYSVWIDGLPQPWATNVGPAKPDLAAKTTLVLSYALRTCTCKTGFTSGTREFDVRSVAIYEDKEHKGVGIEHGGIAPGTKLG